VRRRRLADRAFRLKQQCCPHCGRRGTLNRHSRLTGNDPDQVDRQRCRGQRVFCSHRGRRGGCGRTFAIFFAEVLPRHSVPAALLARLLANLLGGATLKAAAEALQAPWALETFYRLIRRLRRRLDAVRARLWRERSPPACGRSDPLLQTVEHLRGLGGGAHAVAAYQLRFQQPLLG
jgi:hypothetical protein